MNNYLVNTVELGAAIKRRRGDIGYSFRKIEAETGVSPSTLSRIEAGIGYPDSNVLASLADWLNSPIQRFLIKSDGQIPDPVIYFPEEPTPEIVRELLKADRNLTPATSRALADLFDVAYRSLQSKGGFSMKRQVCKADRFRRCSC